MTPARHAFLGDRDRSRQGGLARRIVFSALMALSYHITQTPRRLTLLNEAGISSAPRPTVTQDHLDFYPAPPPVPSMGKSGESKCRERARVQPLGALSTSPEKLRGCMHFGGEVAGDQHIRIANAPAGHTEIETSGEECAVDTPSGCILPEGALNIRRLA